MPKKVIRLQSIQFRIDCNLFQSAETSCKPISECANDSHIDFRVRERVAPQFQSAQTCRTPISECANESHLNLRVLKRTSSTRKRTSTLHNQ